jgi:hypothetical protein
MMSSAPPTLTKVCADCGASNPDHLKQCWLCSTPLVAAAPGSPFKATAYERHARFQFSFASLLVTIALIAVLLGVFRLLPGLGVFLAIIVAPAWIHTCVTVAFRSPVRGPVTFDKKAGIFAASLAIVIGTVVMLIAAIVGAFAMFCGVVSLPSREPGLALIAILVAAGAAGAVYVGLVIARAAWRQSNP